jgi:hypothetical protein
MTSDKDIVKFEENPYNPESKGPEEIVRLFYSNNVPILPVVSKRGLLLGILTKESVISELSDIERVGRQKIDAFITKLFKKMSLDELLPVVGNVKEFVVINLFGEIYGNWSRLDLFAACETGIAKKEKETPDIAEQRNDQALEWMIYLVLEHIPRALYALNDKGKTVFYNSHFEDIYFAQTKKEEVDTKYVETSLANTDKNDFFYRKKDSKDMYFFNKNMKFYYEKVPMISNEKNVGYLIFVDPHLNESTAPVFPGLDISTMSLTEMIDSVERSLIVDSIRRNNNNLTESAKQLKLSVKALSAKIKVHGITL